MSTKTPTRPARIEASIPLHISGTKNATRSFSFVARTITISRSDAKIAAAEELASGQEIQVRRLDGGGEAPARVVGYLQKDGDWDTFGIVFTSQSMDLWDAELPEANEPECVPSKDLLECVCCHTCANPPLTDIQAEVFAARGIVTVSCSECASWTVWTLAPEGASPVLAQKKARKQSPPPKTPEANRRKHARIPTKSVGCISYGGVRDEIVRVKDASRGGFRFQSPNAFNEGSQIMVAVPYTRDAVNVFVPARIMWCRELPHLDRREYGVAYTEHSKERSKS